MAQVNFPDTTGQPTDGTFQYTENNVTYSWNGVYWSANNASSLDNRFVNVIGDTMTGNLVMDDSDITLENSAGDTTIQLDASTGDVQMVSLNGGPLAGFRNQLINGDFRVWQRGTPPMAAPSVYTADRWYTNANVATVERKLYNNPPGTGFGFDMRAGSAANMQVRQGIELPKGVTTAASPFDVDTQWTISLWSTRVPSVQFDFADGVNGGNTVSVYAMTQMNSTNETSGVYTKYSATFTINVSPDINNNECLSMRLQHTAGAVGESWIIAGVQLEPGPVATPFEHRPISAELALCQRYYQRVNMNGILFQGDTDGPSAVIPVPLVCDMRVNATVTEVGTNSNIVTYNRGTYSTIAAAQTKTITGVSSTRGSHQIQINRDGGGSGSLCVVGANTSTGRAATFNFDAEL